MDFTRRRFHQDSLDGAALQSKEVWALAPGPLAGRKRSPCGSWSGLDLRGSGCFLALVSFWSLFFLCFPHLFVPSDFPCDFYSWMMCDNFPFHQPTWLRCSVSLADIYYCSYLTEEIVPHLVQCLMRVEPHPWVPLPPAWGDIHLFSFIVFCPCEVDSLFLLP